ncbi:phosphatidylglycerophosphatase A [Alphaproteobacteria bacterium]|nr:phosphatidylglycerophosphatase A [Alphaproteobacteria bacterium]
MGRLGKVNSKILSLFIISFFGTGLISKKMPGTVGSIFAFFIAVLFLNIPEILLPCSVFLFFIGAFFCDYYIRIKGFEESRDPAYVVIDEACGVFLGAYLLKLFGNLSIIALFFNLILFRIFDIFKPFPIKNIESYMKKNNKTMAFGIMFDDVLAAFLAATIQIVVLKLVKL